MPQDRTQMMQSMLGKMGPKGLPAGQAGQAPGPQAPTSPTEDNDPKSLIDTALEQATSYVENPELVTPETLQDLVTLLQQASAALEG
jgi:hypothetical protein